MSTVEYINYDAPGGDAYEVSFLRCNVGVHAYSHQDAKVRAKLMSLTSYFPFRNAGEPLSSRKTRFGPLRVEPELENTP